MIWYPTAPRWRKTSSHVVLLRGSVLLSVPCARSGRVAGAAARGRGPSRAIFRDDIPRFLRPNCVGRPIAEYAAGYDLVANKVQLEAMRAVGQCLDRKAS